MIKVTLRDGCFNGAFGAGFGGDAAQEKPKHIEWERVPDSEPAQVYTDICLEQAHGQPGTKIAWLIEPRGCERMHYETVKRCTDDFEYILTHDADLVGGKYLYYPLGGSWISNLDWNIYPKTKDISIIVSKKNETEGHKLRHLIVEQCGRKVDVYGWGYRSVKSKLEALKDYRYSIVVESVKQTGYFSEKLTDCFACGTVPIYWGGSVSGFFNQRGIIPFHSLNGLQWVFDNVNHNDYQSRLGAIRENLTRAGLYRSPEDWIVQHYPHLFRYNWEV